MAAAAAAPLPKPEPAPASEPGAEGASQHVLPDGAVARFAFYSRQVSKTGVPKPVAFEPEEHPDTGRLETSICGLQDVSADRLWHLGQNIRRDGRAAIAAIEVPVKAVLDTGLECVSAPEVDFPEHGVILGWDTDKGKRQSIQQDLVAAHTAVHRPPTRPE